MKRNDKPEIFLKKVTFMNFFHFVIQAINILPVCYIYENFLYYYYQYLGCATTLSYTLSFLCCYLFIYFSFLSSSFLYYLFYYYYVFFFIFSCVYFYYYHDYHYYYYYFKTFMIKYFILFSFVFLIKILLNFFAKKYFFYNLI